METYRSVISDIRAMSKLLSSDNLINDRTILSEVRNAANMIMGQAFNKRKYWQSPNVFTPIPCLEMEQVPLSECCEYTGDRMVAISIKQLPQISEGIFGLAIMGVFGLDGKKKFKESNPNRYSNLLKLGIKGGDFFWITGDRRLVVTNEDTQSINMFAFFTEPVPNDLLFPGSGCNCKTDPDIESLCANPLDQRFAFPQERLFDLKQQVYNNLMKVYFQTTADKTDNDVDETGK